MLKTKWTLHRIHKWMGLTAASWLIVLGLTGFLLDHRDTWRWLWKDGIATSYIKEDVVKKSNGHIKYYQINPVNTYQHIAAGLTGIWWSGNEGENWLATRFIDYKKSPMVSSVLFSTDNKLWIATDDGLWKSVNGGITASRQTLQGEWVSAIDVDNERNIITGVIDRSRVFKYHIETGQLDFLNLKPVNVGSLPESIDLSRFTRDIHYGRGVFTSYISLLWNDIAAIALILLPVTGFLFYWLPKKWRKEKNSNIKTKHSVKKHSMRWLFRLHGPSLGLVAAIPIIYISLTGILLDHAKELRGWMKSVQVPRSWQTPVYDLSSWQGEIYGIVNDRSNIDKFSIATRLGLFTTDDNGVTWSRDRLLNDKSNFIWSLRRHGDDIYIGGMGSPNLVKEGDGSWRLIKGVGHMPSDITIDADKNSVWKGRHGIHYGNLNEGFVKGKTALPAINYVPWFYIIDGLHSGILIHTQWKWVNDFISILAIFLVITGLIRWWHKKWI